MVGDLGSDVPQGSQGKVPCCNLEHIWLVAKRKVISVLPLLVGMGSEEMHNRQLEKEFYSLHEEQLP